MSDLVSSSSLSSLSSLSSSSYSRSSNYQKKLTNIGSKSYEVVCAVVIQKYWRGYHVRSKYRSLQRQYYKKNPNNGQESIRKKFYEKELSILSQLMEKDIDNRKDEVDSMLSSMDNTLKESRELDQLFDFVLQQRMMMNRNNDSSNNFNDDSDDYRYSRDTTTRVSKAATVMTERDWKLVEVQVRSRAKGQGYGECAIWYNHRQYHHHYYLIIILLVCAVLMQMVAQKKLR